MCGDVMDAVTHAGEAVGGGVANNVGPTLDTVTQTGVMNGLWDFGMAYTTGGMGVFGGMLDGAVQADNSGGNAGSGAFSGGFQSSLGGTDSNSSYSGGDPGGGYGYDANSGFTGPGMDGSQTGFNGTGMGQNGAYNPGAGTSSFGSSYPTTSGTPAQNQYPGFDLGASSNPFGNLYGGGGGAASSGGGATNWMNNIKSATQLAGSAYGLYDSYQQRQKEKAAQAQKQQYIDQMNRLSADPSAVTKLPGYQFGMDQGSQALNRQLAAQGLTGSGAQMQELQQFGQQYAGQYLSQEQQRLAGLAGMNFQAPKSNAMPQMNSSLNGLAMWATMQGKDNPNGQK